MSAALDGRRSSPAPSHADPAQHAAVSIALAGRDADLSMCFIKRAAHPADPWSGQMALPGGRASSEDQSLRAVAVRETLEEVGLALGETHVLGALPDMPIGRHRRRNLGVLSPFVFFVEGAPPGLVPEPKEVAAAYWIPAHHLWDPDNLGHVRYEGDRWPGIVYRGEIIWGLTLRVLQAFGEAVGRPLPPEL